MTENEFLKYIDDLISWINARRNQPLILSDLGADTAVKALREYKQYRAIGAVEECREAMERQNGRKPLYKHYEDEGEPPYIKISCPNGCRIQLYPVTEKHLAHEHEFCPKCGQKLDWSE